MKKFRSLLILSILLLALFGWVPSTQAQTATVVRLAPAPIAVGPKETFPVDVMVDNVTDLWAFDVIITYDPDYLTVVSVEWGDFLEVGLTIPGIIVDTPIPGTIQCGMSQITPAFPQSGTGVLFTINFAAKELEGETILTIEKADLVNLSLPDLIPVNLQNSIVQIGFEKAEFFNYLPLVVQ